MKKKLIVIPALMLLLASCGAKSSGNGSQAGNSGSGTSLPSEPSTPSSQDDTVAVTGVTLNKTEATLDIGENVTLTANVTPANATNKSVTWSTSDEAVATVLNGRVTAVAGGEATITATTADGGFTATCAVTVNAPVSYGTEEAPLTADQAYALCAALDKGAYTPEPVWMEAVIFTSSWYAKGSTLNGWCQTTEKDQGVQLYGVGVADEVKGDLDLTKDDAVVGYKVVVNGYMMNFNNSNMEFTKCTVGEETVVPQVKKITAPTEAATGVRIISEAPSIDIGSSIVLKARLTPLFSTGTITWESANTDVATVDANGKVTGVAEGTANVVAKVGELASTPLTVTVNPAPYVMKCNFATKEGSTTSYSETWNYNDNWSVTGGANNGGQWAFVKLGKKNSTDFNSSIQTRVAATEAVKSVDVSIITNSSATTLYKDGMSVTEYGVRVFSDAELTNKVDEVKGTKAIAKSFNEVVNFVPTTGESWAANNYYQVYFVTTDTSGYNGLVVIDYVQLNR